MYIFSDVDGCTDWVGNVRVMIVRKGYVWVGIVRVGIVLEPSYRHIEYAGYCITKNNAV